MTTSTAKEEFIKKRSKLRKLRLSNEITTDQMAKAIGISRRQYWLKEKGEYPFKDYEMLIISKTLKVPVQKLFFE